MSDIYIPSNDQLSALRTEFAVIPPSKIRLLQHKDYDFVNTLSEHLEGRVGIDKFNFTSEPFHLPNQKFKDEDYCDKLASETGLKSIVYRSGNIILEHFVTIIIKHDMAVCWCSNVGKAINGHNGNIVTDAEDIARAFASTAMVVNRFLKAVSPQNANKVFPLDSDTIGVNARFTEIELAVQLPDPEGLIRREAMTSLTTIKKHPTYIYGESSIRWSQNNLSIKVYDKVAELNNKHKHPYRTESEPQTRIEITLCREKLAEDFHAWGITRDRVSLSILVEIFSHYLNTISGLFSSKAPPPRLPKSQGCKYRDKLLHARDLISLNPILLAERMKQWEEELTASTMSKMRKHLSAFRQNKAILNPTVLAKKPSPIKVYSKVFIEGNSTRKEFMITPRNPDYDEDLYSKHLAFLRL